MKKVVFLGLGYIGLPTAAVAAAHGFEVIGVDVNPSVVETINQGKIHIVEPELGQVVRDVVQSGKLRAVCKPEAADAFFIVVPTPFKQNHRADITYVEAATRSVIPYLQEGNLFVIESTSPVYTLLSRTRIAGKYIIRTGAQRPRDRRHRSGIHRKSH